MMPGEFIDFECAGCESQTQVKYGEEETDDDGRLICEDCSDPDFPVTETVYVYDEGTGWEAVEDVYGCRPMETGSPTYEVALDVEFYEDGSWQIVGVNGREVVEDD